VSLIRGLLRPCREHSEKRINGTYCHPELDSASAAPHVRQGLGQPGDYTNVLAQMTRLSLHDPILNQVRDDIIVVIVRARHGCGASRP